MNPTSPKFGSDPSIGVVVPAFNREDTIERAVDSVLSQSRAPDQVVVVDDGSTDSTVGQLRRFGSRIRVIEQRNSGVSAARNAGVAVLDTEWVAFLDSDDHWYGGHLSAFESAITLTAGRADLYFRDACSTEFPEGVSLWDLAGFEPTGAHELVLNATEWLMMPLQPFVIPSSLVRRTRYLEVGGMWPALRSREDTHLYFVLGMGRPFCAVGGAGVEITADDSSGARLTSSAGSGTSEYERCTVRLYRDVLDRFPDTAPVHRRELRGRLADGYISLAAEAWEVKDPAMFRLLARALWTDPGRAARRCFSWVRRRRTAD